MSSSQDPVQFASPAASLAPTEPATSFTASTVPDEPETASPQVRWVLDFMYPSKEGAQFVECYVCEGPRMSLEQSQNRNPPALVIFSNAHVLFTAPPPNYAFRETFFLVETILRDFGRDGWGAVKPDNINSSLCSVGVLLGVKTHALTKAMRKAARQITKGCMDIPDDGEWDCTADAKDLCECRGCLARYGRQTGAGSKRQLAIDEEEEDRIENRTIIFRRENISYPFVASSINPASPSETSEDDDEVEEIPKRRKRQHWTLQTSVAEKE
ncbi:hypothetical protein AYO20_11583 [Fonsecaea nubica]|uniref:Uncharacterized protein n=1 Tax=Fonsecaea nubica TaxID=856822 RepID=A0A178BPY7_9EURO|nr:hypothetical protein AYO20_11583 [Fonsecaea nubica]OAL19729.1 hypothetical protein AYO20_11583 [Fonsecaea nubica]